MAMTLMEFAGRMGTHIAAHAIGMGCEIESYAVAKDAAGNVVAAVTRLELRGVRKVTKIFPARSIAQMEECRWLFGSEAERLVALLLNGEGELT